MSARPARINPTPADIAGMTIDGVVAELNRIGDRAELVAFLAPLRLPTNLDEFDRGRLATALTSAAARCWGNRFPGRGQRS